jgi:CRISPR-associated protein Cas2
VDGGRWVICKVGGALGGSYGSGETLVFDLLRYSRTEALAEGFQAIAGLWGVLQLSIFRCVLSQRERERLRWELEKILTDEDSLLIAGLCDRCVQRVVACNRPETWPMEVESFRIF